MRYLILLILLLSACMPQVIVVTATPTPLPTNTATPEPTATNTPSPTPTRENLDWIDERPINANAVMMDGCTNINPADFDLEVSRIICIPNGWDWNGTSFSNTEPPPDNMKIVRGSSNVGADTYLEMRIDDLNNSAMCFAQYEPLLRDTTYTGQSLNYVFKLGVQLIAISPPLVNIPSANFLALTDGSKVYSTEHEIITGTSLQEFLWVVDPKEDYGLHYQFCIHFHGLKKGMLRIYTMAVYEAGDAWGNDVEVSL